MKVCWLNYLKKPEQLLTDLIRGTEGESVHSLTEDKCWTFVGALLS